MFKKVPTLVGYKEKNFVQKLKSVEAAPFVTAIKREHT